METLLRLLATISALMIFGTVGGMEWGHIAKLDGIIRIVIFMFLTAQFHKGAEYIYRKKRKKRRANRSTSSVSSYKKMLN